MEANHNPVDVLLAIATAPPKALERIAGAIRSTNGRTLSQTNLANAMRDAAIAALIHRGIVEKL